MPIVQQGTDNDGNKFTRFECDDCGLRRTIYPDGVPSGWKVLNTYSYPYKYSCNWCQQFGVPPHGMTHEVWQHVRTAKLGDLVDQCHRLLNLWMEGEDTSLMEWGVERLNESPLNTEEVEHADVNGMLWAMKLFDIPTGKIGTVRSIVRDMYYGQRGAAGAAEFVTRGSTPRPVRFGRGKYDTMVHWLTKLREAGAVVDLEAIAR